MINQKFAGLTAAFLFLVCVASPVPAREGADPGINRPYQDPDYRQWVERFERPGREVYDRRADIVRASHIRPGQQVADIGAGTGLYTLLFADAVGNRGRVYAVDIARGFLENLERRAKQNGYTNISTVVSSQTDTRLPPDSIDVAFVCDTYHHFEQPRAMLASIRRALRSGGELVVVDFDRIEGKSSGWVLDHVRAGKSTVIQEISSAGFRLAADEKFLKENFFLRFVKQDP